MMSAPSLIIRPQEVIGAFTPSPQEYELMARKMGWTTKGEPGLPPPPSIEELEKSVKAAETPKP
jgi:hypothetical protein